MKDQDNKINALCYCKDHLPVQRSVVKEENKTIIPGKQLKKQHGEREEPWSVFGEWYWI
ncbi:MAG: hypothetical protein V4677_06060 [Bacteroidota bacterium]